MSTGQAAEFLGVNSSRVRQLCRSGELVGRKVGRDWLIRPADASRFKQARLAQLASPEKRRGRPFKT